MAFLNKKILTPTLFLLLGLTFLSTPAFAAGSCGGVETSIVSCSEDGSNAIWSILEIAVNVLAGLIGIVAVGGLVYGAVLYSSAGDNAGQVTKSKTTIANVVIGLVLFAGMYSFIQFLIPGGVFGRDLNAPVASNTPTERPTSGNSSSSGSSSEEGKSNNKLNSFKIANFNILGYNHTEGSKRPTWPNGDVRFSKAMQLMKNTSVAALQEMHAKNQNIFKDQYLGTWGYAAGNQDYIIWKKEEWKKVSSKTITIPYFQGEQRRLPFVLLEQRSTKAKVWFMGVHNPASVSGQKNGPRRKDALDIELAAIKAIKDKYPIFAMGDFNDSGDGKNSAQCVLTPTMKNVFGKGSGICGKPSAGAEVDHIFYMNATIGSANVNNSTKSQKISDHPLVTATVRGS